MNALVLQSRSETALPGADECFMALFGFFLCAVRENVCYANPAACFPLRRICDVGAIRRSVMSCKQCLESLTGELGCGAGTPRCLSAMTAQVAHVLPLAWDAAREGGLCLWTSSSGSPHISDTPLPALGTDECPACCPAGTRGRLRHHQPPCLIQLPRTHSESSTGNGALLLISGGHCHLPFPL